MHLDPECLGLNCTMHHHRRHRRLIVKCLRGHHRLHCRRRRRSLPLCRQRQSSEKKKKTRDSSLECLEQRDGCVSMMCHCLRIPRMTSLTFWMHWRVSQLLTLNYWTQGVYNSRCVVDAMCLAVWLEEVFNDTNSKLQWPMKRQRRNTCWVGLCTKPCLCVRLTSELLLYRCHPHLCLFNLQSLFPRRLRWLLLLLLIDWFFCGLIS